MRKASLVLVGAAVGVALTIVAIQPRLARIGTGARPVDATTNHRPLDLFGDALAQVRARYVVKPDDGKLMETAVNGMLSSLDNSSYIDAKSLNHVEACTGPGCPFGIVGVELTIEDGLVKVVTSIADTPAAKAGVMARDIITRIDDDSIQGLTLYELVDKLRGSFGTKIRLTIVHPGQHKPIEISFVRDAMKMRSVRAHPEGGDIGYIRVRQFNEQTTDQLKKAIDDIAAQIAPEKLKGYVVDLRSNPGGLLDTAISVADAFLEEGEIVSIRGRNSEETRRFRAKAGDLTNGKPVVVLINAGSASEAEVVAGALQDHKRATIVGTRSFGMGSVKTMIPLNPGNGAIRLTTGHYFTPAGRLIKANGISPDVEVPQDIPDDLKPDPKSKGNERSLLQSYIPQDPQADKALNVAYDLLRGTRTDAASQPTKTAVPN
ncbi:MAG: S41 family peptidase [Xanthobacteraceae bacterium]